MKNEVRMFYKKLRREMSEKDRIEKSKIAQKNFLETAFYKNAKAVMLYVPICNETETRDIIESVLNDNKKLVFPVTCENSLEITPYYADENTDFLKGGFSVPEPTGTCRASKSEIDLVLVPGIAFDRSGGRIGFGKGCYDRFLKDFNGITVGFSFEIQVCDNVYSDEHDIKMDYLVTEKGIYNFK